MTNWYIRFNRKRLKGTTGEGVEDTTAALDTLFQVLFTIVRALAPFIPFITEHIYGLMKIYQEDAAADSEETRSVHFLPFPVVQEALFDEVVERKISTMQKVIELARIARDRCNTPLKTPLLTLVVVSDSQRLSDLESLQSYVKEELNIKNIVLTGDEDRYNIRLEARVDWPTLGKQLKKDVQIVRKALPSLSQDQLRGYQRDKKMTIDGIELGENDLAIVRVLGKDSLPSAEGDGPKWEPAFAEDMIVLLDAAAHPELLGDGFARDLIARVQRLRKKAGLIPTDDVRMQYSVIANPDKMDVGTIVSTRQSLFKSAFYSELERMSDAEAKDEIILEEEQLIGDLNLLLRLTKL